MQFRFMGVGNRIKQKRKFLISNYANALSFQV